jgi:hypothetical protein
VIQTAVCLSYGILTLAPWVSLFPGAFIMLAVLALNVLGDGLHDAARPRSARRRGSFRRLVLDLAGVGDPARDVEDLEREQVSVLVVVEDRAGLVLVAFCDGDALFDVSNGGH